MPSLGQFNLVPISGVVTQPSFAGVGAWAKLIYLFTHLVGKWMGEYVALSIENNANSVHLGWSWGWD